MEPKNGGLVQMFFLCNWVVFRFQPLIFRGFTHPNQWLGVSLIPSSDWAPPTDCLFTFPLRPRSFSLRVFPWNIFLGKEDDHFFLVAWLIFRGELLNFQGVYTGFLTSSWTGQSDNFQPPKKNNTLGVTNKSKAPTNHPFCASNVLRCSYHQVFKPSCVFGNWASLARKNRKHLPPRNLT